MANPAWKKTAAAMVPDKYKKGAHKSKPASSLELEWVHGYRGFDARNNVRYVNDSVCSCFSLPLPFGVW